MIAGALVLFLVGCWWLNFRRDSARTDFSRPLFGMTLGALALLTVGGVALVRTGWAFRYTGAAVSVVLLVMILVIGWVARRGLQMKAKQGQ